MESKKLTFEQYLEAQPQKLVALLSERQKMTLRTAYNQILQLKGITADLSPKVADIVQQTGFNFLGGVEIKGKGTIDSHELRLGEYIIPTPAEKTSFPKGTWDVTDFGGQAGGYDPAGDHSDR